MPRGPCLDCDIDDDLPPALPDDGAAFATCENEIIRLAYHLHGERSMSGLLGRSLHNRSSMLLLLDWNAAAACADARPRGEATPGVPTRPSRRWVNAAEAVAWLP